MSVAVMFNDVSYSDMLRDFSFEIEAGGRILIVTAREEESTVFTRLMAGLFVPDKGSIALFGSSAGDTTPEKLMDTRRNLGFVTFHGGLVSNLKMWENIFLPYFYHIGKPEPLDDELAHNYLNRLNCSEKHLLFPAHLSLFEKRVAAFTRAAIMQPDIMIYCNTFERISTSEQIKFASVLEEFHKEKRDRTSIYLASTSDLPVQSDFDQVLYIHPEQNRGTVPK
jgi:ABC-type transporter Mla maintaining outer membrane lipid asymmetry ATPase subunit MlaF